MTTPSTRKQTKLSGRYQRTTSGSQSLERGLALLRAFRVGTGVLTNAELAARSDLPRPTVSRLTRSLVETGFLAYDHKQSGYRLGAVHLSLALSFRDAQPALDLALPLMRDLAEAQRVNVGIAVLDQSEMIYLDSVRFGRSGISRRLLPGTRTPAALTALGRACLSSLPRQDQILVLKQFAREYDSDWPALQREIKAALANIRTLGYCWAQWQPRIFSVATPIRRGKHEFFALNISLAINTAPVENLISNYGALLQQLKHDVLRQWQLNEE